MVDTARVVEDLKNWASAVRLGINGSTTILQALVLRGVLTKAQAIALIDDLASAAEQQTSTTSAQKQIVAASYEQSRELLDHLPLP